MNRRKRREQRFEKEKNHAKSVLNTAGEFDTSYVAVIGPKTAWSRPQGIKLVAIKNPSTTILLVEMKSSGIKWAEPRDLDLDNLPPGITKQSLLKSLATHIGGFNAVFADWHVELLPSTMPYEDFEALTSIDGSGEKVDRSKWDQLFQSSSN